MQGENQSREEGGGEGQRPQGRSAEKIAVGVARYGVKKETPGVLLRRGC